MGMKAKNNATHFMLMRRPYGNCQEPARLSSLAMPGTCTVPYGVGQEPDTSSSKRPYGVCQEPALMGAVWLAPVTGHLAVWRTRNRLCIDNTLQHIEVRVHDRASAQVMPVDAPNPRTGAGRGPR